MSQNQDSKNVVVFITSFNRRETTLRSLESLTQEIARSCHLVTIYLMDDLSPDGTGEAVKVRFPEVNVLYGNGKLYWAGGVRLILETIGNDLKDYDGILLINDDVMLNPGSLDSLIEIGFSQNAIIGGTVMAIDGQIESSGSLLGKFCKPKVRLVIANGNLQKCDLLPGHIMMIPMSIYEKLNGFDKNLPFRFLDLEFTHRASKSGISVLLAPNIVATTDEIHNYFHETSSMRGNLSELISRILLDPKGPYWKESAHYLRKVSPLLWWLWLPFFYRAFFVAVLRSYYERIPLFKKSNSAVTHKR